MYPGQQYAQQYGQGYGAPQRPPYPPPANTYPPPPGSVPMPTAFPQPGQPMPSEDDQLPPYQAYTPDQSNPPPPPPRISSQSTTPPSTAPLYQAPQQHLPYGPPPGQPSYGQPPAQPAAQYGQYAPPPGQAPTSHGFYHWNAQNGAGPAPAGYQQPPLSSCTGKKKALLIGINYFGQQGQLRGCINDVVNVKNFLMQHFGFRDDPNSMLVLTDDQRDWRFKPTRGNIVAACQWLVGNVQPGDSLFFHFSGHGGQVKDVDGDEGDGYDETILPVDWKQAGQITDDELHARLVKTLPPGVRLTAIFDACHSGTMLDLPYTYYPNGTLKVWNPKKAAVQNLTQGLMSLKFGKPTSALKQLTSAFTQLTSSNPSQPPQQKQVYADVVMFSGCKDQQTSADAKIQGNFTGAMSFALVKVLSEAKQRGEQLSYGMVLGRIWDVLKARGYSQKPQMSTAMWMNMSSAFIM